MSRVLNNVSYHNNREKDSHRLWVTEDHFKTTVSSLLDPVCLCLLDGGKLLRQPHIMCCFHYCIPTALLHRGAVSHCQNGGFLSNDAIAGGGGKLSRSRKEKPFHRINEIVNKEKPS